MKRESFIFLLSLPFVNLPAAPDCLWLLFSFSCSGYAWVQECSDDLLVHAWPMPPSRIWFVSLSAQRCPFAVSATVVKWTHRWKPILVPCGSNFQIAYVEEWVQEVHTSDDQVQECGHRWQDPGTWSRRAHELSEKENVRLFDSRSPCVRSPWISTTFPMVHMNPPTTDGTHLVVHRLHHQVCHLRSSLPGSLARIQIRRRALGFSVDIFPDNLTSQQQ